MKKKSMAIISGTLAAILTIPMAGFAGQNVDKPAVADSFSQVKEVAVAGATSKQVFNKVLDWAKRYTISSQVNPDSGLIVSQGEIAYPSPGIDRIQYSFIFTVKNSVKGNKNTVIYEKVLLKSPTTYNSETGQEIAGTTRPITTDRDKIAARKVLTRLTGNLETHLLNNSDTTTCALTKCPECATLGSSNEDLQVHMKVHDHGAKQHLHTEHNHNSSK